MTNVPFSITFSATDELIFGFVLADIPLFCVGLLGIAIFTFLFFMKRVNLIVLYLCSAALLLFICGIFDLIQLVVSHPINVTRSLGLNTVSGFTIVREVGFSFSSGFLFLYLWMASAERPISERHITVNESDRSIPHSASWNRWGTIGIVLKLSTLALVIVISLLQIIWRLLDNQRLYGNVYIAAAILEIVISVVFVLKIFLNVLILSTSSWWIPFRSYIALLLGLTFTIVLGVGNLASFAFSERVLGRFLHAIGIYVLLLNSVINIFSNTPSTQEETQTPIDDLESQTSIPAMGKASSEKPNPDIMATNTTAGAEQLAKERSPSIIDMPRESSTPLETPAPPAALFAPRKQTLDTVSHSLEDEEGSFVALSEKISRPRTPIRIGSFNHMKKPDIQFKTATPASLAGVSSYYFMSGKESGINFGLESKHPNRQSVTSKPPPEIHDPLHLNPANQPSLTLQPFNGSADNTSTYEELIRQKDELDRSFARLQRLTGNNSSTNQSEERTSLEAGTFSPQDEAASNHGQPSLSSVKNRSLSLSSVFSYSAFPQPPQRIDRAMVQTSSPHNRPPFVRTENVASSLTDSVQLQPMLYVPGSPSQNGITAISTPRETQYDVTSFIGDLTEPGDQRTDVVTTAMPNVVRTALMSEPVQSSIHDGPSKDNTIPVTGNTATASQNLRPMILLSATSEHKSLPPIPGREQSLSQSRSQSQLPLPEHARSRESTVGLKPLLLGSPAASIPTSLSNGRVVPITLRGHPTSRPTGRHLATSGPNWSSRPMGPMRSSFDSGLEVGRRRAGVLEEVHVAGVDSEELVGGNLPGNKVDMHTYAYAYENPRPAPSSKRF